MTHQSHSRAEMQMHPEKRLEREIYAFIKCRDGREKTLNIFLNVNIISRLLTRCLCQPHWLHHHSHDELVNKLMAKNGRPSREKIKSLFVMPSPSHTNRHDIPSSVETTKVAPLSHHQVCMQLIMRLVCYLVYLPHLNDC